MKSNIESMVNALGMIPTDFKRPTIHDIEIAYNIHKQYNVSEEEFWSFINSKFKNLRKDDYYAIN